MIKAIFTALMALGSFQAFAQDPIVEASTRLCDGPFRFKGDLKLISETIEETTGQLEEACQEINLRPSSNGKKGKVIGFEINSDIITCVSIHASDRCE